MRRCAMSYSKSFGTAAIVPSQLGTAPARTSRRAPSVRLGKVVRWLWAIRPAEAMYETQEFQLLMYCARSQPDAGSIRDLIKKGINWERLLQLAERHGVRPMLHRSLKSICWDFAPQTTQRELERFYTANAQRSLLFAGELLRLVAEFVGDRIPIAAFKGIILAEYVYGDLSLREFSDLDIMVPAADTSKAEDILTNWGYVPDFPDKDYRSTFLAYQGQYAFRNKQTGISVDLHWRLSDNGEAFPLKTEQIWSRLEQVMICGRTVPTLVCEDLLLFLAAHGTKEGWRFLKWLCDFGETIRKHQDIDWITLLDRAERSHCSRSLQLAMLLASALLDAPVPQKLIAKARNNSAIRALADKAQRRMLCTAPVGELREFLNGLNTHDRLRHRLWPVARLLTTRTVGDYQAMPLPKSLWSLYYATRPFRLTAKGAELLVRRK